MNWHHTANKNRWGRKKNYENYFMHDVLRLKTASFSEYQKLPLLNYYTLWSLMHEFWWFLNHFAFCNKFYMLWFYSITSGEVINSHGFFCIDNKIMFAMLILFSTFFFIDVLNSKVIVLRNWIFRFCSIITNVFFTFGTLHKNLMAAIKFNRVHIATIWCNIIPSHSLSN